MPLSPPPRMDFDVTDACTGELSATRRRIVRFTITQPAVQTTTPKTDTTIQNPAVQNTTRNLQTDLIRGTASPYSPAFVW